MPTIDELDARYFVQAEDASPPSQPRPQTFTNSRITPIIDCDSYNHAIDAALAQVGTGPPGTNSDHFILIANWWLGLSGGEYQSAQEAPSGFGPSVYDLDPYGLDPWSEPGSIPLLHPPGATRILLDILRQKAQAGVDVRVAGWVSFAVMDSAIAQKSGAGHIARVNSLTMQSIQDLRAEPSIAANAILNVLGHTVGAVHLKMVVIGTNTIATAFTGGLDFEYQRWSRRGHQGAEGWHDVVARVDGPAVQALYDYFRQLWNENLSRKPRRFRFAGERLPSYLDGATPLPNRTLPVSPAGSNRVQSLRTVPQFNYRSYNCLPENSPVSFAPDGLFEYRLALQKALTAADTYIYMEDQAYWSQEILSWVNQALRNNAELRVILLFSGRGDPNDPGFDDAPHLTQSINNGLLLGLTEAQLARVRLFRQVASELPILNGSTILAADVIEVASGGATSRITLNQRATEPVAEDALTPKRFRLVSIQDPGTRFNVVGNDAIEPNARHVWTVQNLPGPTPPQPGTYFLYQAQGVVVHSKTVLVDDNWAVIGSGNCMRRSLYTDFEHGVSFLDEEQTAVAEYRMRLWADHFDHPEPFDFELLSEALHSWESSWGSPGLAPGRPGWIVPMTIPLPVVQFSEQARVRYDAYEDPDSREPWGGVCPPGLL